MQVGWGEAPKWARYHATNRDGEEHWFENEPRHDGDTGYWEASSGRMAAACEIVGYRRKPKWRQSLKLRPTGN